jgi:ParB family transcriptional regulator, chromosome partitioning protein
MTSGNSPNCVGLDANIGDNVREYPNGNKPFLDSIAEHGVLVPLTAIRRPDGAVEVRNGSCRTVAARKIGLSTVPVYVLPATAAETIDRIVHQMVTNDHKRDLTDAQRARGIQQMIDAGLSVTKVAKIHRTNAAAAARGNSSLIASLSPLTRRLLASVVFVDQSDAPPPWFAWPNSEIPTVHCRIGVDDRLQ